MSEKHAPSGKVKLGGRRGRPRSATPAQALRKRRPSGVNGERLRSVRERCGYTQAQLADRAGVGQSLISQLENGHVEIEVGTFKRICKSLATSADFLIGLTPRP